MPEMMVLVGMLICGNYNKLEHSKASKQTKKPPRCGGGSIKTPAGA